MEKLKNALPKNVILDLLPAYLSGEVSEESRMIVEEYAKEDPDIANLIRSGLVDSEKWAPKIPVPKHLEMVTLQRIRSSIRRKLLYVALITASILMIPFLAMLFTDEVNWTASDFLIMGTILIATGLTYVFISSKSSLKTYKFALGLAIVTGFLLLWSNLAVGIIGAETNPLNLLYIGVFLVGITGAWVSRFQAKGMFTTLLLVTATQILIPVIALILEQSSLQEPPGMVGVFIINLIFGALFALSALLFWFAARQKKD